MARIQHLLHHYYLQGRVLSQDCLTAVYIPCTSQVAMMKGTQKKYWFGLWITNKFLNNNDLQSQHNFIGFVVTVV